MSGERQLIPARHGTATFVPRGHTIKIINTYGKQVIDTWAFALHQPPSNSDIEESKAPDAEKKSPEATPTKPKPPKLRKAAAKEAGDGKASDSQDGKGDTKDEKQPLEKQASQGTGPEEEKAEEKKLAEDKSEQKSEDKPQENPEAKSDEKTTEEKSGDDNADKEKKPGDNDKSGEKAHSSWTSYLPSLRSKKTAAKEQSGQEEQKSDDKKSDDKKSDDKETEEKKAEETKIEGKKAPDGKDASEGKPRKSWSEYIPSGFGFTSYLPSKGTISAFAGSQWRDPNKSYAEQLYDFSKTPVGAATLSGTLIAFTFVIQNADQL